MSYTVPQARIRAQSAFCSHLIISIYRTRHDEVLLVLFQLYAKLRIKLKAHNKLLNRHKTFINCELSFVKNFSHISNTNTLAKFIYGTITKVSNTITLKPQLSAIKQNVNYKAKNVSFLF